MSLPAPVKEMRRVSASRLNSIKQCTYKFYAGEILNIPEKQWQGTTIGSLVHSILECVYRDYYSNAPRISRGYYHIIKASRSIYSVPAIERLISLWQQKHNLTDKILKDVNPMVLLVINHSDFLDVNAIKRYGVEHEFKFVLPSGGILKGYLDRLTHDIGGFIVWDYKSQKKAFLPEEVENSYQSLCYQLYVYKTFGALAEVKYVLLRFPPTKSEPFRHIQTTPPATPSQLLGFEQYLDHMYGVVNNFTLKDACSGYHVDSDKNDGYGFCDLVCSYRRPMKYISVKKKGTNELVKNYMIDKAPQFCHNDEYMETLSFRGCPKWNK